MLEDAASAGGGTIVSLTEAEFIDASVIHALFVGDRMLRAEGQRLVLHVATASIVSRALDVTGISRTLQRTASLEDALRIAGAGS